MSLISSPSILLASAISYPRVRRLSSHDLSGSCRFGACEWRERKSMQEKTLQSYHKSTPSVVKSLTVPAALPWKGRTAIRRYLDIVQRVISMEENYSNESFLPKSTSARADYFRFVCFHYKTLQHSRSSTTVCIWIGICVTKNRTWPVVYYRVSADFITPECIRACGSKLFASDTDDDDDDTSVDQTRNRTVVRIVTTSCQIQKLELYNRHPSDRDGPVSLQTNVDEYNARLEEFLFSWVQGAIALDTTVSSRVSAVWERTVKFNIETTTSEQLAHGRNLTSTRVWQHHRGEMTS